MTSLSAGHCIAAPEALDAEEIRKHLQVLHEWQLDSVGKKICREFGFSDYDGTITFVNAVAGIADSENHHPEMQVGYNRCKVCYQTHSVGGLTLNDFICASRIDDLYSREH